VISITVVAVVVGLVGIGATLYVTGNLFCGANRIFKNCKKACCDPVNTTKKMEDAKTKKQEKYIDSIKSFN